MSSANVVERPRQEAAPAVRDLLLLWQHPENREIVPIGRFARDGSGFSFAYTQAATQVQGFRTLPGLNDLHRRYDTKQIPAVFVQRVMDSARPDYSQYLNSMGLDPEHATPWEQIVSSGGVRVGDTLQFMQVPRVADGRARARFLVNGVRHVPEHVRKTSGRLVQTSVREHEQALERLHPGDTVGLEPDEDNAVDSRATLITTDGTPLGWVPRALSAGVRELLSSGPVNGTVIRVGTSQSPPHLRLVVDMDAEAQDGFEFDREGSWRPVA